METSNKGAKAKYIKPIIAMCVRAAEEDRIKIKRLEKKLLKAHEIKI